jgi:hypothetical protein
LNLEVKEDSLGSRECKLEWSLGWDLDWSNKKTKCIQIDSPNLARNKTKPKKEEKRKKIKIWFVIYFINEFYLRKNFCK